MLLFFFLVYALFRQHWLKPFSESRLKYPRRLTSSIASCTQSSHSWGFCVFPRHNLYLEIGTIKISAFYKDMTSWIDQRVPCNCVYMIIKVSIARFLIAKVVCNCYHLWKVNSLNMLLVCSVFERCQTFTY